MTTRLRPEPVVDAPLPERDEAAAGVTTPIPDVTTASAPAADEAPADTSMSGRIETADLNVYYGAFRAVRDITMTVKPHAITAIIGPSGCGKSTFLRTLNRMHELTHGTRVEGIGPPR